MRRERVCLVALKRKCIEVGCRVESGPFVLVLCVDGIAEEQTVHAVFIEHLVHAKAVLLRVIRCRRVEIALIEDWGCTWNIVGAWRVATSICGGILNPQKLLRGTRNFLKYEILSRKL